MCSVVGFVVVLNEIDCCMMCVVWLKDGKWVVCRCV